MGVRFGGVGVGRVWFLRAGVSRSHSARSARPVRAVPELPAPPTPGGAPAKLAGWTHASTITLLEQLRACLPARRRRRSVLELRAPSGFGSLRPDSGWNWGKINTRAVQRTRFVRLGYSHEIGRASCRERVCQYV